MIAFIKTKTGLNPVLFVFLSADTTPPLPPLQILCNSICSYSATPFYNNNSAAETAGIAHSSALFWFSFASADIADVSLPVFQQ